MTEDDPASLVGLCEGCFHVEAIANDRGSVFYRCRLSFQDPRFPKYPRLPVLRCTGYQPKNDRTDDKGPARDL